MKYKEILEAVLYMNDVENQGTFEIPEEECKDFETIKGHLEAVFGKIIEDEDEPGVDYAQIEWGKRYFYSYDACLATAETMRRGGEQNCLDVDGAILNLENGSTVYVYLLED